MLLKENRHLPSYSWARPSQTDGSDGSYSQTHDPATNDSCIEIFVLCNKSHMIVNSVKYQWLPGRSLSVSARCAFTAWRRNFHINRSLLRLTLTHIEVSHNAPCDLAYLSNTHVHHSLQKIDSHNDAPVHRSCDSSCLLMIEDNDSDCVTDMFRSDKTPIQAAIACPLLPRTSSPVT